MIGGKGIIKQRRIFSLMSSVILLVSILLIRISIEVPEVSASAVDHNVGELDINALTDYGRILSPITWGPTQTTNDPLTGSGFIGLVLDQDNYNHTLGSEDIADSFSNYPYFGGDDLIETSPINMIIDDGVMQKSIASFQNTGTGTGDPNDILINQTVWTVKNKDWAILQWTLNNLKNVPINNVCFGLELPLSQVGAGDGVGGDNGDDIDGYDSGDNIYWAQDDDGTTIGFGSAIVSDPITHYYSEDYAVDYETQYKFYYEDDTWLYNRLHTSNSTVGITPGSRSSTVGWNDFTLKVGSSKTFTLVIAINDTFANMKTAFKDAQYYYRAVATGFRVTEFSDFNSPTQQIEVFNFECDTTDLAAGGYFLSIDNGATSLSGNWDKNPLPIHEYAVFTLDPGENIGPEGGSIGLYQDMGGGKIELIDHVSYGQKGVAPDPLNGESVARRYDASEARYTNEWLRNVSSGPTWGAQNDVSIVISSPWVVLNRVLFNPEYTVEGYVELMYPGSAGVDISGYRIVCDDEFIIPSGTILNWANRFYVLTHSDYPINFDLDDGSINGDNVYLYDKLGNLLDMVGWSSPHTKGYCISRNPEGNGTYQGYDDVTSQAAGWVFNQAPDLLITEFYADTTSAQIEVYNSRGGDKIIDSRWILNVDSGTLTGNWAPSSVPNGGYSTFTMSFGGPGKEGDTIKIYYLGSIIDEISFGIQGVAPDPLVGESTARYWDANILEYNNNWTRESTPTFGSQNDVLAIDPAPQIRLNEVMFNPSVVPDGRYMVIMNNQTMAIDISNYLLVCDEVYQLPMMGIPPLGMLIFRYMDDPAIQPLFNSMDPTGDNVYLYDKNGRLLDMVGWNSPHTQGMSVRRVPDGNGTYKGHNDVTSEVSGWVFDTPLEVLMTEISDSGSNQAQIEVYNPMYPTIDFSVNFTFKNGSVPLTGVWSIQEVASYEYTLFNITTPNGLSPEGDTISFYQNDILIEEISYGLKGRVPDPLPNESVERYWDGSVYTDIWERNHTTGPNFGAQNDVPHANLSSAVLLSEILFNPVLQDNGFVEIYLRYGKLDISGYKIVGNSEYIIPNGIELTSDDRFFYLTHSMNPAFFDALCASGDNLYFYDNDGALLDMAGWSSSHTQGKTMCRIPSGNGTRDGFDDMSSMAAGWVFDCPPSVQMIKISTEDYVMHGNFSEVIYFNLSITNKQSVDDTVFILNSTLHGFPVVILDGTRTFIVTEIFVPAKSYVNITVMITLTSPSFFIEWDNITVTIQSQNNTLFMDNTTLQAIISPFILPEKSAFPQVIYLNGTGHDEISTITLNLVGMGSGIGYLADQDVIFCVDTSGSMSNESVNLAKEGMIYYVENMSLPDRGAVVHFASGATLMNPLSDDYTQLKEDIKAIPGPGGGTNISLALNVSIGELLSNGIRSHIQVIILLTDGGNSAGPEPVLKMAELAAANNITIYTVGLGNGVDEITLRRVANITGGQYFFVEDPIQLPEIYMLIATSLGANIAGKDPDIRDAVPMVRDVLPPWIDLVEGSFSRVPDTNYVNETGYRILEWNISRILIGSIWEVTFQVKSNKAGWVRANDLNTSRVYYQDFANRDIFILFPECLLHVLGPPPEQPTLYINISPDGEDTILNWDPPQIPGIDHYLIYRSTSQTNFDFNTVWKNTSADKEPGEPSPIPLRTMWNDTNAAFPGNETNYEEQYYYVIRAVNDDGEVSRTSRTVGKWTRIFLQGISTFSLPLEPLETMNKSVDYYLKDMNAGYIKWMHPGLHKWMKHGDSGVNNTQMKVGEGYEVKFDSQTIYTFTGMPGAMISYDDDNGFLGFDHATEAKNLTVIVEPNGDVNLSWQEPGSMRAGDWYEVYYSIERDGFFKIPGIDYSSICPSVYFGNNTAIHYDAQANNPGAKLYYMVVPFNASGVRGASTYSIGIWTEEYLSQYDTIGIPLKLNINQTADWYCDNIPDTVGINYYNISAQRWSWHSKRMPSEAYDPLLVMTEGYQISTSQATKYTFIGV